MERLDGVPTVLGAGAERGLPTKKLPGVSTGVPSVVIESGCSIGFEVRMDSATVSKVVSSSFPEPPEVWGPCWRKLPVDALD